MLENGFTSQQLTLHEAALSCPDFFLATAEEIEEKLWVYEKEKIVFRSVTYVPALYRIFEEILENAADNFHRDPKMDSLKVEIYPETNTISVYNNGDGIPVEIHPEHKAYIPEMLFSQLFARSNYKRNTKRTTGGYRGCGAKLANIFSTEFLVEIADGRRLKKYKQKCDPWCYQSNVVIITVELATQLCVRGCFWSHQRRLKTSTLRKMLLRILFLFLFPGTHHATLRIRFKESKSSTIFDNPSTMCSSISSKPIINRMSYDLEKEFRKELYDDFEQLTIDFYNKDKSHYFICYYKKV